MVIPLRSGRQNHPLGLGESGRRHGRDPPALRRDPSRRHHRSPASASKPAGQDPGQAITPGRRHYRSVRSRMPVLSATIFDAVFVRAGFGTCRLGLITVWLPVRVLPAPPRTPTLTEISRGLTNSPRFRGGVGPAYILCSEEGPFRAFCLWRPKTVSPESEK